VVAKKRQSKSRPKPVDQEARGAKPVGQEARGAKPIDRDVGGAKPIDRDVGGAKPAGRAKSPAAAAALSFLFPGTGQLYMGRRLAALVFAVPAIAVVVWALLQLSQGLTYFAVYVSTDQDYALTVMLVAAAFTLWRLLAIAHPFVAARPGRPQAKAVAVLAALLIATVGMGDVVFSNAYNAYNLPAQIAQNDYLDATDPPGFTDSPEPDWSFYLSGTDPWDLPDYTIDPAFTCPPYYNPPEAVTAPKLALAGRLMPAGPGPQLAAESESPSPTTSPEPTATPEPTAEPTPTPSLSPTPTPSPSPTPTPSPSPTPTPNPNRMTILLVGVDFISGRNHALTDTLMLVSIDLETNKVAMVSVPRDTANFPFYWGGQAAVNMKINGFSKAVARGSIAAPDTPMVALANEIGYLVGVRVDYYAAIDMGGFVELIDLVGGIDVNNPRVLDDPFTCTYVPKGLVHMDGAAALRYARSRESSNDYYRAGRQQLVMMALRRKLATPAILPQLGGLMDIAGRSIATNFPLKDAKDYVSAAENVDSISNCVLGPPYNYHPPSSQTKGSWTSRLKLDKVANLSVYLFGTDSLYYGQPGVVPTACQSRYS
jgi:LCP family protein required for cell wall assembly